jgi:hypothetical protein
MKRKRGFTMKEVGKEASVEIEGVKGTKFPFLRALP